MRTVIEMAQKAEFPAANYPALVSDGDWKALERFAELVRADERNRLAIKLVQDFKGAFGDDTCASWAVWIKEQK